MILSNKKKDISAFIMGLFASIPFNVIGTFYGIEIIAFLSLFFIPWKRCYRISSIRTLTSLGFLWLSGAILVDLYNGTLFTDCLKGWFNIIFMMLLIPFAYWLLSDNPKRFLWYYLGQAISSLYSFYYIRSSFMDESSYEKWEVYAWYNILNAIGALLYYKGWHKLSLTYLICLAFYFLFNGSRNIFLVSLLSVCILYVIDTVNTKKLNVLMIRYKSKLKIILCVVICGGLFANFMYEKLASGGHLGEKAQEKYYMQKNKADGNVLKGGRGEFFTGLEFILRNPIVGYGSYPTISNNPNLINKYNIKDLVSSIDIYEQIPAHSHIVGFWLWHGMFGVIFWFYILKTLYLSLKRGTILYERNLVYISMMMVLSQIWNIFFSPLGFRMPLIMTIIYIIITQELTKNKLRYEQENISFSSNRNI